MGFIPANKPLLQRVGVSGHSVPSGGGSAPGSDLDLQWPAIRTWLLCMQQPSGSWSLEHRPRPGLRGGRAGAGGCPCRWAVGVGSGGLWQVSCSSWQRHPAEPLARCPGPPSPPLPTVQRQFPLRSMHRFARALGPPAMRIWLLQSFAGPRVGSGPPPCSLAWGGGGDGPLWGERSSAGRVCSQRAVGGREVSS